MALSHPYLRAVFAALLGAACASSPGGSGAPSGGSGANAGAGTSSGGAAGGSAATAGAGTSGGATSTGGAGTGGLVANGGATSGGSSGGRGNAAGSAGTATGGDGNAGDGGNGDAGASDPGDALTVFYLDVGGRVMATDVINPAARTIVADAGQGPDGIALDLEHGHIYWTGMGVPANDDGFLRRSDLDGGNVRTIVAAGGTFTPKQLRLEPEAGKLYWADREGMRVMRSNLDGSGIETLVTTGSGTSDRNDASNWCVGIALDVAGGYVYWSQKGPSNGNQGSLRRARLTIPAGQTSADRSDVEVLFAGLPEPIDIDLDLETRRIYWTDRGDDTVNRAPLEIPSGFTAATRTDREVLLTGVREAIGITLDLARGKLYFTGGTGGRVGMANLDGSGAVDLLTGSAGLTGIVVAALP
jgi:hypothetical protein